MAPATAPDLAALLARLDSIDLACREARWDEAEALYADYDAAVRALPPSAWRRDDLERLMARQQSLATLMRDGRDAAASELAQFGAQKRSARAYRG
jgi:hypothetical protein